MKNNCIAEAIGTFAMVFAGCGAIVINDVYDGAIGHLGISLVFGLVVMAMIYAVGNISGAHFNPAVTIGFYMAGRLPKHKIAPYILSQLAGAVLAATLLKIMFPEHTSLGATLPKSSIWAVFVLEVVLTFFLIFVILNVTIDDKAKGIMAGVAIGATVALNAAMGGPVSGASMNPARSFAPALLSGELTALWLYIIAPIVGALLAYPSCRGVQGKNCCAHNALNS